MKESSEPAAVVQRQLDAYNARDVDAILATHAEDAQQFEFPAKLLASGTVELREGFAARFQEPNLHAQLLNRTVTRSVLISSGVGPAVHVKTGLAPFFGAMLRVVAPSCASPHVVTPGLNGPGIRFQNLVLQREGQDAVFAVGIGCPRSRPV